MSDISLKIDPEFKRMLPELSLAEYEQLEKNIMREGCREPLVVWDNIILDGHHRYAICRKHRLPFQVKSMAFSCREEAIRWICLNQIGRRNISPVLLKYQIGKRYNAEKVLTAHNPKGKNQFTPVGEVKPEVLVEPPKYRSTAYSIGKQYNISHTAVNSYKDIAAAIDIIATKDERLSDMYLAGHVKIKPGDLAAIADMGKWQIRALTNNLIRNNKSICRSQDVLDALSTKDLLKESISAKERRKAAPMATQPSVKDMPTYDPDSEVASLSLTIPSWNSSIDRVFSKADMRLISIKAKTQLRQELLALRDSVDLILLAIEEEMHNG